LKLIYETGGFPSSHASAMSGLATAVGIIEGFDSTLFAIAAVLMLVISYDAMNIRYYAGKNIQVTKQLIKDLKEDEKVKLSNSELYLMKMKEVLGHKGVEVIAGLLLGIITALGFYYLLIY
jgi:acid phosphatase family membrane protein YuiD